MYNEQNGTETIEYPKRIRRLTDDELRYTIKDAGEALAANPDATKSRGGYYADEINYCQQELARRNNPDKSPRGRRRELTEEQSAARDERRARFKALAAKIRALTDEQRAEIASLLFDLQTIEGRALSVYNRCLIGAQNPAATVVGGYRQWRKAGRFVRKGERGLSIWIPIKREGAESEDPTADPTKDETRFICGTVFDVSQTELHDTQPTEITSDEAAETMFS